MATQVYTKETFELQNYDEDEGPIEVVITPLPIKHLRPFMEEFHKLLESDNLKDDLAFTDILFKCAKIAIFARNNHVTEDQLEDMLDLPTIVKIVELAGGVTLDGTDPNPATPTKA